MNGALLLMGGMLAIVTVTAYSLTLPLQRKSVLTLLVLGLLAAWLKVLVVQSAPQWHDVNPDSITYELNGRAFAAHWQGQPVDGDQYRLHGLAQRHAAGLHGSKWQPDETLSYAFVVGSHEWLYAAYVGLFYRLGTNQPEVVIASNVLWAAFLPVAAFGIALALRASRDVALAAATLALIDPNTGVNASWLLKDTLASFLTMAAVWVLMIWWHWERGTAGQCGLSQLRASGYWVVCGSLALVASCCRW